jgi:hypothetical protein
MQLKNCPFGLKQESLTHLKKQMFCNLVHVQVMFVEILFSNKQYSELYST